MKTFHFSAGDNMDGPVGFCAEVEAETEVEALEKLKAALPESHEVEPASDGTWKDIAYCNVYFNPDRLTIADIDEVM
jgi:hypothetical protein